MGTLGNPLARLTITTVALFLLVTTGWAGEMVHSSDFEDAAKVSDAWSSKQTSVPPNDKRAGRLLRGVPKQPAKTPRRFLGEFASDTVTLSLKSLPKHSFLRISFDLLILKQWGGAQDPFGTGEIANVGERWGMQLDDGPLLIHGVFVNNQAGAGRLQTYPCLIPGEKVVAKTGAVPELHNTLGYLSNGGDATYRIKLVIPHTEGQVRFNFFGENLIEIDESSWGLDNVTVEAMQQDEVPPLTDAAMKEAWDNLADTDPARGYEAAWKLIASPEKTLTKAEKFLSADSKATERAQAAARLKVLVAQLDANEFRVRERAMKELDRMGSVATPLMRRLLRDTTSPEVRTRLETLLAKNDAMIDPARLNDDGRRRERLGVVLGIINTPTSKNLLQSHFTDR